MAEITPVVTHQALTEFATANKERRKRCKVFQTSAQDNAGIKELMQAAIEDFIVIQKVDNKKTKKPKQRKIEKLENNPASENLGPITIITTEISTVASLTDNTPAAMNDTDGTNSEQPTRTTSPVEETGNDFIPKRHVFTTVENGPNFTPEKNPCVDYYNKAYGAAEQTNAIRGGASQEMKEFIVKLNHAASSYENLAVASHTYTTMPETCKDKNLFPHLKQQRIVIEKNKKVLRDDLLELDRALLTTSQKVATLTLSFIGAVAVGLGVGLLSAAVAGFGSALFSGPAAFTGAVGGVMDDMKDACIEAESELSILDKLRLHF